MPELPEVETIKNALAAVLPGRVINAVATFTAKLRESLDSLHDPALTGRRVLAVRRRGRYLVIDLEGKTALLMHFGMSGVLRLAAAEETRRKHEHILFTLDGGVETLRFECPRRFSLVKFVACPGEWPEELAELGVEPLSTEFTGRRLYEAARRRKVPVKALIMDNAVVVGVGNIYATEALFAARIAPLRPAGALTAAEAEVLTAAIKAVLRDSIAIGGTTIHDYRHLDGSEGAYVLKLHCYGNAGSPCPRCGARLTSVVIGGRTSAFCPECQK